MSCVLQNGFCEDEDHGLVFNDQYFCQMSPSPKFSPDEEDKQEEALAFPAICLLLIATRPEPRQ